MLRTSDPEISVTLPSEKEIVIQGVFNRPRELLYEAWTKPEHVRQWWGCDESSVTICAIDFRVGGAWRLAIRMPDGSDHLFHGTYREIVPNCRLVYTECYDRPEVGSPQWLTTVTFEDAKEGTLLTHSVLHASREARDGHLRADMEKGAIQTLRRLHELTARMARDGTSRRLTSQ